VPDHILENGDSPELEALFDSIAQTHHEEAVTETAAADSAEVVESGKTATDEPAKLDPSTMYEQIGLLTRKLHDTLQAMGYDKQLEKMVESIPDAKDRLNYIATLTEAAAERVLNATDIAKPIQDALESRAQELEEQWGKLFDNQLSVDDFKRLAIDTRTYLNTVPAQTQATSTQLLEIVMAQDFQDLTGQVIKKMMDMVKGIEHELVSFLVAYSPTEKKAEISPALLNGPVINPEGRADVVTSQQQVDDLLESLGF